MEGVVVLIIINDLGGAFLLFVVHFLKAELRGRVDQMREKFYQELKSKIGNRPKSLPTVLTFWLLIISFE